AIVGRGREVEAANFWVAGRPVERAVLGAMGAGISPYPYFFIFPQDEHERLLIDRLSDAGLSIERDTELVDFEESGERILAREARGWADRDVRCRLHRGLRRRPLARPRHALDRLRRRDVRTSLLRRRRLGARRRDERRAARGPRQDGLPRGVSAERRPSGPAR